MTDTRREPDRDPGTPSDGAPRSADAPNTEEASRSAGAPGAERAPAGGGVQRVAGRALDVAGAVRRRLTRRPSRTAQAAMLVVALALFIGVSVWSWRDLDVSLSQLRLVPLLLLVFALIPATIVINAVELWASGRLLGVKLAPMLLLRTVVVATAANLAPIPGAAMVRVHALRTAGCRLGASTSITVVTALVWIGWSATEASVPLMVTGQTATGIGFLAVGLVLLAGSMVALARQRDMVTSASRGFALITAVELGLIAVSALRLVAVLATLGIDSDVVQAMALTVSGALAAGAGVFPGGLGLAELISGALGPLIGLTVASAVVATAFNRIAGLAVTAPIAAFAGASVLRGAARLEQEVEHLPADEPGA